MTNVNYDIERHEKMIFQKAEGSKVIDLVHRVDAFDSISDTIILKIQKEMKQKASRQDFLKIATATDRLSSTVQVLHEAHLLDKDPSSSISTTSAAAKCLTCNRSIISVASDSTFKIQPKHLPAQPMQSKIMPLLLQKARCRPKTSTPSSKKRRQQNQWNSVINQPGTNRPSSSSGNMISSIHSNGSVGSLVELNDRSGSVQRFEKMTPLFNYVKGCDGRIFRASA
jgi:hypothetical protein